MGGRQTLTARAGSNVPPARRPSASGTAPPAPARPRARPCVALLLLVSACATGGPACPPHATGGPVITVLSRGWHTEIAIPAAALSDGLARLRGTFPGARFVVFGYGKRTFLTARANRLGEFLIGPFPGPAVIEAIGIRTDLATAYGPRDQVSLTLPPGGAAALSGFIWNDLAKDAAGAPLLVARGRFAGSLLYAARSRYGIGHTCNAWVIDAVRAAGLPVSPRGVVFSGQAMAVLQAQACAAP